MSDGGGARATVELLLHLHSFKNVDLRSRGQFCVEAVAFPQSAPKSPGVPFRTYCDPTARRSAARGVAVAPCAGDVGQQGTAGTSAAGLPAYKSSLLPIRFTNEKVQLSEGASFRIHLDADWLETDVITVEFRLMYRALPEGNEDPNVHNNVAPSEEAPPPEPLKEVGKVTLHAKCAAAKGGLHRYHPLVFAQPYLCLLDVTFHMALTAINHPGGPAGLAAAIAAHAFPSEDLHPAPRGPMSPARASTPTGSRTQARSASVGRLSYGSASETPPSVRPRFQTPGRSRRSTFGGNSISGWNSSLPTVALRPRVPMTAAALEAAGSAVGLATALGYAPAALDPDRGGASRAIFRAAELLYSRHALGLKWSQGTLAVTEAAATEAAAAVAAAAVNAAETALVAAKKKGVGQHGVSRKASSTSGSSGERTLSRKSVPLLTDTNAKDLGGSNHGGLSSDGVDPWPAGKVHPRRSSTGSGTIRAGGLSRGKPPVAAGATAGGGGSEQMKGKATVWSKPSPKPATFLDGDEEADAGETWTWQAPPSPREKVDMSTIPLPSDVRQLSRVIHARLSEESAICSGSWAAFATATFECKGRGLYSLREKWVRETQRAWSGQCVEILSMDRADLLKLDEAFLEPDGFIPLRARAGIRLRRRASPTRSRSRKRKGRRLPREPLQVLEPAQGPADREDRAVPPLRRAGSAVKAAQAMLEAPRLTNGSSSSRRGSSKLDGLSIAANGAGDSGGAVHAGDAGSNKEGNAYGRGRGVLSTNVVTNYEKEVEDDDDEGPPPLLDALERRIPRPSLTPGTVVFTPRSSPMSSSWSTVSPWGGGSASSSFRNADQGWFARLATGGTGSSLPTVSGGGAGGGTAAGTGGEGRGSGPIGSGAVTSISIQFPPPPMSLLPLFNRDLHGFEAAAVADDRWTELPFVVVESWGGVEFEEASPTDKKECVPDSPLSPCSPAHKSSADEFRRFQRIASNSFQENASKIVTALDSSNGVLIVGNGNKAESNVFDDEIIIKDKRGDFRPANGGREVTTSSAPDHDTSSTIAASVSDDEDAPPGLPDLIPTPTTYKNGVRKPQRPWASPSADGGEAVRSPSSALPPASPVSVSSLTRSTSSVALPGSPISMTAAAKSLSRSLSWSPSLTDSSADSPPDVVVSAPIASVRAPFADVALPPPPYSASVAPATAGGASRLHPPVIEGNKLLTTPARTRSRSPTGSPATVHRTPGKGTPSGSRRGGLRSPVVTTIVFGTPSRPRQPRLPVNVVGADHTPSRARGSRSPVRPSIGGTPPRAPRSPRKADEKAGSIWDVPSSSSKKAAAGRAPHHVTRRPLRLSSLPPRDDSIHNTSGSLTGGSSTTNSSGKFRLIERAESLGSDFGGCSSGDDFFVDEPGAVAAGGARGTKGKRRRKSKRAEIRRKMWGRRPSWATALLAQQQTGTVGLPASGPAGTDKRVRTAVSAASGAAGTSGARESGTNHLVVLVHGLGGRPADMALMRGYLQALMPGAELMVATSLQDIRKENSGVEALGHKLAEEVHEHITRFCPYFATHAAVTAPTSRDGSSSLPLSPVTPLRVRGGAKKGSILTPGDGGTPGLGRGGSTAEGSRRRGNGRGVSGGVAVDSGSENNSKGVLSFVCFSMGGLVTRSALLEPAMVPYLSSLHCLVTLACPHLGQTSTPLSFFKTGAWAFRKLTGLRVLHELDLDDAEDPRETALYRLSFSPGLERFRTIVFAANTRDGFVPLHSASVRLSPPSADSSDSRTRQASAEMAEMLMSKVDERKNRVVRMTLDNPKKHAQSKSALDSMIGRAGHMCFIDSPQVAWLISLALLPFLEESPRR